MSCAKVSDNIIKVPALRFSEFIDSKLEYKRGRLIDFGSFYYGKGAPKGSITEDAKTPCVRYGELYSYYREEISEIKSYTNVDPKNLKLSKGGEVLIPRVGENPLDFANCSYLPIKNVAIGEMISVYNTKENGIYLTYYINSKLKYEFAKMVEGASVSNLYFRYLEKILITIPQYEEQTKIVEFISEVDKKIKFLTRKKQRLEIYKKGIMQKIFNQEIKFKDDAGSDYPEWEFEELGKKLIEYKEKSEVNNEYTVLTSSNKGLMLQSEYYGENRLTDRDNKEFNIIPPNHITYRSRSDNRRFTFNLNNYDFKGIISKYYPVFKIEDGCNRFLVDYLNISKNHIGKYSVGTSQTVLSFTALKKIKLLMPCKSEQLKIGNVLKEFDNKINQLSINIENIKKFKIGLLQQMFV